jgi:hypothetical protein
MNYLRSKIFLQNKSKNSKNDDINNDITPFVDKRDFQ